jgi:hypothetical protein
MAEQTTADRFRKAVGILVDEQGRIKERLLTAFASQLSAVDPERDIPRSMMSEFDAFRNVLSDAKMPYGYGEHAATKLKQMSDEDASALARQIFAMFLRLNALEQASNAANPHA